MTAESAPPQITRSAELPWLGDEHGSGTTVLWLNPEAGWFTLLVKGAAGQVNPPHTHVGGACFYVLSGGFDYRGGSARAGDWVWEPAGSVHDATTHPVDTVYLAQIYGPVALHGKDGRPPRMVDWRSTQRLVDRAAGGGPAATGFDPIDAALVQTSTAGGKPGRAGREAVVLRVSPDTGHARLLIRAKAGSEDPARWHLGACEIYVLEGSLDIDGAVLHAGDHLVEPAGSRRGPARAVTDATYLVSLYGPVAYTNAEGRITGLFDWQAVAALAS